MFVDPSVDIDGIFISQLRKQWSRTFQGLSETTAGILSSHKILKVDRELTFHSSPLAPYLL